MGNHFYFSQQFFAFLLDRAASRRVPKEIFCAKKPGTNAFPVKAALPARGANRVTRFLKMSGVTPCRIGRLIRSVAVLAVFLAPSLASAATISGGVDERGHHYLSLDGSIAPGDPEKLAAAIFEANARGYQLDALRLNSPGGPIWEAMAMAVMIRWKMQSG